MKKLLKKDNLIILGIIFIYVLIISILNYYEVLNYTITSILNMILGIFIFFLISFKISRKKTKKGYLWGLKTGFLLLIVFFILSIILQNSFSTKTLIYYIILLLSSISAGIIGINK